jgi:hypothetical protein
MPIAIQRGAKSAKTHKKGNKVKGKKKKKSGSKPKRQARQGGGTSVGVTDMLQQSGFLKCSLAGIDFDITGFHGVPDNYSGKAFAEHWDSCRVIDIAAGSSLYIILCPAPGVVNLSSSNYSGAYQPSYYSDYSTLFGDASGIGAKSGHKLISQYRMVSNSLELTNTTPNADQGGSIRVKSLQMTLPEMRLKPITVTEPGEEGKSTFVEVASGSPVYDIMGYPPGVPSSDLYIGNGADGIYTAGYNTANSWDWKSPLTWETHGSADDKGRPKFWLNQAPEAYDTSQFGEVPATDTWIDQTTAQIRGWDNDFSTKLVVIKAPKDKAQSYVLRSKQCVEFRPSEGTPYDRIASLSPDYSPKELALYAATIKQLPIAVTRAQNDNFWAKVKRAAATAYRILEKSVQIGGLVLPLL